MFLAYVCACVCVCVFSLFKSKVWKDRPTVQSISLAEYLRRHDICDVMFRQRADMDHARADMGAHEGRYGSREGRYGFTRAGLLAFVSRAISARVTKQIMAIYSKTCDKLFLTCFNSIRVTNTKHFHIYFNYLSSFHLLFIAFNLSY